MLQTVKWFSGLYGAAIRPNTSHPRSASEPQAVARLASHRLRPGGLTISILLASVVFGGHIAPASAAALGATVNTRGTFLRTGSDAPSAPTLVNLADNALRPGDGLRLRYHVPAPGFSFVSCGGPYATDEQVQVLGVFSASATLLDSSRESRVPDAIDAGPDYVTSPTYFGGLRTDIPQDFRLSPPTGLVVTIPQGATHLFLGIGDTYYSDNCGNPVVTLDQADTVAPTIVCGSPDDAWHPDDVSIACTAQDAGTGLLNPGDAGFSLATNVVADSETANAFTNSRSVCDRAGNCRTAGPLGPISVDKKAPDVACQPATFVLGEANAMVYAGISDSGSGAAVPKVGVRADTSTVGTRSLSVSATDEVGNTATAACVYTVRFDFGGFLSPVNPRPTFNVAKAGSALPVKFSLGGNQGLDILETGSPASMSVACSNSAPTEAVSETTTLGGGLRYDADTEQYIYVWKTDRAWTGTCRQLSIALIDGTAHTAQFKFE